jgi:hypothetical protein
LKGRDEQLVFIVACDILSITLAHRPAIDCCQAQ